jgi:hypothetical protein
MVKSHGQSKVMIELNEFDRSEMRENINMNILISSMKIKMMFSSHVKFNTREVSAAWGSRSHVPAAYVTYISSSGRIIIQPCQAIQKYQIRGDTLPIHVDHILRLFRAYEAAMASTTIRGAGRQTGFEYENRNMTTYLSISEGQIRE